jgi:hypothetical protein
MFVNGKSLWREGFEERGGAEGGVGLEEWILCCCCADLMRWFWGVVVRDVVLRRSGERRVW